MILIRFMLCHLMALTIIALILTVYATCNSILVGNNKFISNAPLENISLSLVAYDPSAAKKTLVSSIYKNVYINNSTKLCKNGGYLLKLLIIIHSAPSNYKNRSIIRQTWGSYGNRSNIDIGFILGQSLDQSIENSLPEENNLYGDIISGQFIDTYDNLTLKSISMLEWVDKKCPHASYILKTDEDVFINIPNLLQFIDSHKNEKNVIFGSLAKQNRPIREKDSKYYVSPEQFSGNIYPEFTTGPAYLISSDIIHKLYTKSLENTYLKLEDVFITGIIAHQLNIIRIDVFLFFNYHYHYNPVYIKSAISILLPEFEDQLTAWEDSYNKY